MRAPERRLGEIEEPVAQKSSYRCEHGANRYLSRFHRVPLA